MPASKGQFDKQDALYFIRTSGRDQRKIVELNNANPSSAIDWSPDESANSHRCRQISGVISCPKFSPDGPTIDGKAILYRRSTGPGGTPS